VTARLRVDLDAVPKNRVPDWIEGHEHAPDELAVVEENTHSHESGGRGKAHGDRCRRVEALLEPGRGQPAQGGVDWTAGRGTAGARVLRARAPGRRGVDGREQKGRGCRWGQQRLSWSGELATAGARPEQRAADAVEKRGVGLPPRGSGSGSRRGKSKGRGGGRLPQLLLPQPPTQLASTAWARATASARRWSGGPRWRRREQKRRAAPTSRGGQRRPAQGADRRLRARQDLWVGAARGEKERAAGCAQVGAWGHGSMAGRALGRSGWLPGARRAAGLLGSGGGWRAAGLLGSGGGWRGERKKTTVALVPC
jgi:hypothetical protein